MDQRQRLTCSPATPAEARQWLRAALAAWGFDELVSDAVLVMDEIVTNAIRHAGGSRELSVALQRGALRIAVSDGSPRFPERRLPSEDGGRGMRIVEMLSSCWGVEREGPGKTVWADLPASGASVPPAAGASVDDVTSHAAPPGTARPDRGHSFGP